MDERPINFSFTLPIYSDQNYLKTPPFVITTSIYYFGLFNGVKGCPEVTLVSLNALTSNPSSVVTRCTGSGVSLYCDCVSDGDEAGLLGYSRGKRWATKMHDFQLECFSFACGCHVSFVCALCRCFNPRPLRERPSTRASNVAWKLLFVLHDLFASVC